MNDPKHDAAWHGTKSAERPTALCPACGKRVAIRQDGRMREHISRTPEWPGSPFKKRCSRSGTLPEVSR